MSPGDACDEIRGIGLLGVDAAPVEADIDLDEHVDGAAGVLHDARPAPRHLHVIDDERQMGAVEQREHAIAVDRIQRVGQPDVGDAMPGEDLRFAELRAADADRAARDLDQREIRTLVGLRVRPEPFTGRLRGILHPLDVALDPGLIHEHAGCAQGGEVHGGSLPRSP